MPDMRQLLETAKGDAPPPRYGVDDIVDAGRRRRRWVLSQRIGGAGVAVVAAVTGLLLVSTNLMLSGGATGGGMAAPPAVKLPAVQPSADVPPFTFTFGAFSVGAYNVLPPQYVSAAGQHASITTDYTDAENKKQTAYLGGLNVYRPGVVPASTFSGGAATALTVQGRTAYESQKQWQPQSVTSTDATGVTTTGPPVTYFVLAWQYADNAWAVIDGQPEDATHVLSVDVEVSLAEHFDSGVAAPVPAKVPFTSGYLPAGWRLQSINGQSFGAEDIGSVTVTYAQSDPAAATAPIAPYGDNPRIPAVVITIGQQDAPPADAPKHTENCNTSERFCSWPIPGTRFYLLVRDPSKTLTTDELLKVGQGLVFDNIDRSDTWHLVS